jgi:hypothetical protein
LRDHEHASYAPLPAAPCASWAAVGQNLLQGAACRRRGGRDAERDSRRDGDSGGEDEHHGVDADVRRVPDGVGTQPDEIPDGDGGQHESDRGAEE